MVVPMALANATRLASDVGLTANVMYHRGAYHATGESDLSCGPMRNAILGLIGAAALALSFSGAEIYGIAAWKIVLAAAGAVLFVTAGKRAS
jgi:uncharacterized membrane protein YeaQ/YmgE (transglycosylase-associated protein family)